MGISTAGRRWTAAGVAAAALVLALESGFAEAVGGSGSSEPPPSGWTFDVTPYLWLPEQEGTLRIGDLVAPIDVDFGDLFDLLGNGELLSGMVHLEAHKGRLSLFVDAVGGTAQPTTNTERAKIDTTLNYAFVEFGPAYTVLDWPTADGRSIRIDALAGGRYMYFYTEIDVQGRGGVVNRSRDSTLDWVDPFVGGRFQVPLLDGLDLFFRGDIGGFDAGSELAWNVLGGFRYELPWHPGSATTSIIAAYKALDFDYETGGGTDVRRLSLDMRGPALGLMFSF